MQYFTEKDKGITRFSKDFVEKHLPKIGKVKQVIITWDEDVNYMTAVIGEEAVIQVFGFSLGYGGEGPNGLAWLLRLTNMQWDEVDVFGPKSNVIGKMTWLAKEEV